MRRSSLSTSAAGMHKMLLDELSIYPEVRTAGFWAAMRDLPDADYVPSLLEDDEDYLRDRKFIPDAWAINEAEREVTIFEVVVTHDIPPDKIDNIVNFAWALDEDHYALGLVRCDLTGRRVYDCLSMAMLTALDCPSDEPDQRFQIWQRYTTEYCRHRKALQEPDTPASVERLNP